jgi:hypothetical protein
VTPRVEINFPNPVGTGSDLFDREPEMSLIQDTLRSATRRPVVIMGERVMGKTSLLNIVVEWAAGQPPFSVVQLPHVSSREAFVEEILDGIAGEVGTSLHRLGLRDSRGRLHISTVTEFARVAGQLSARAPDRVFLLCLEELDSMLVNCPDDASANQILDLILHVVAKTTLPIKFVFTITRTAPHILRSDASPFLSAARIAVLGPWTSEEVRGFVGHLLRDACVLDEDAHRLLFDLGGGHPYLTKAILQALLDLGRPACPGGTVTGEDLRHAVEAAMSSPEVDFTLDNIVKVHFSDEELQVLRAVAAGAADPGDLAAAPAVLHELRQRRYLRVDGTGRYRQAFGLLSEWLRRRPWTPGGAVPGGAVPGEAAPGEAAPGVTFATWPGTRPADFSGQLPTLLIDDIRKRVFLGPNEVPLTAQEYRFLNCLVSQAGTVVDRYTIATEVWSDEVLLDGVREGRLDALVYRLREELGADAAKYVETRRGRGYYVNPDLVRRVPGTTA